MSDSIDYNSAVNKLSYNHNHKHTHCIKCGGWLDLHTTCSKCQFDNEYYFMIDNVAVEDLQNLHSEVQSIQKTLALILRILPEIVHKELVAHQCKCRVCVNHSYEE